MKSYHTFDGLLLIIAIALFALFSCASETRNARFQESPKMMSQEVRGRYLIIITGCNDCHTHGFAQLQSNVPESDWLTGDSVGWQGPWGTTYAINLRLLAQTVSEDAWVKISRIIRSKPPMPWWTLYVLNEDDLRSMYRFIRILGPKGENAPASLPPNQKPKTPYIVFVPQFPK